jgi:hypothetical protein
VDWNRDGLSDLTGHGGSLGPWLSFDAGGQFSASLPSSGATVVQSGTFAKLGRTTVSHQGRFGDRAATVTQLSIRVTDQGGQLLSAGQLGGILDSLGLWRDDGDGVLELDQDLQVASLDPLLPTSGDIAVMVASNGGAEQILAASTATFFVAGDVAANADQVLDTIILSITPDYDATTASDPDGAPLLLHLPLDLQQLVEIESGEIFSDGFETGNTSAWSLTVP